MKDCIIYSGCLNHDGYAYSHGKQVVKRLWEKHFGKVPDGKELAHTCDVRSCINLVHVYPATHAENMADRYLHKDHEIPVTQEPTYYHERYVQRKEVFRERSRQNYIRHRETILARQRIYYAQNRESILRKAKRQVIMI